MNQSTDSQTSGSKPTESKASESKVPADSRQSTSDSEQLADHLRSIEGVDEDIAEMLASNWQKVVGALLLVLLAVVLVHQFRGAKSTRQAGAAERLSAIQRSYQGIINQPPKVEPAEPAEDVGEETGEEAGEEATTSEQSPEVSTQDQIFIENSDLLVSTNQGTIYGDLAVIYQATRSLRQGDFASARSKLEQYNVTGQPSDASLSEREVLISELASLLYARVKVAEGRDLADARQYLKTLVEQRRLVALEALIMLVRLSDSDETLAESKALAVALQKRQPELADLVKRELGGMGITLDES